MAYLNISHALMNNSCSIICGNDFHYLDHLAPLSSLLQIPLITDEEQIVTLAEKYYPDLKIIYKETIELPFFVTDTFDQVIYCFPNRFFRLQFDLAQTVKQKSLNTIWCPHGYSDKDNLQPLKEESSILVYGNAMKERVNKITTANSIPIGNFRLYYFQLYKNFYEKLIRTELPNVEKPIILFAPTWENNNIDFTPQSFYQFLKTLPQNFHFLIKLHPNTCLKWGIEWEIFQEELKDRSVTILDYFTPIYPLLEWMDLYVGDFSSIGYDALYFEKPILLFKKEQKKALIDQCSLIFDDLYEALTQYLKKPIEKNIFNTQKDLYHQVFDPYNAEAFLSYVKKP